MALLLLFQTLAQRLHQLLPTAQRLDLRFFLVGQQALELAPQPFLWNVGDSITEQFLDTLEMSRENPVEAVELGLVLDQAGA